MPGWGHRLRGLSYERAWARPPRGTAAGETTNHDTDLTDAVFGSVNTGVPPLGLTNVTGARFGGPSLHRVELDGFIGWPSGHGEDG
ncbi:hypothetical protein GCM10018966_062340 [Streptomyces yanii]